MRAYTKRRIVLLMALVCGSAFAAELHDGILTVIYHEDDARIAEQSVAILNAAMDEFGERLPAGEEPIRVIIAHTPGEFARHASRFSQVTVSGIARSREGIIVVKAPYLRQVGSDFRGTLRHELVHVLLYRNTDTDTLPRWLNEGIAMSLANEYRWASPLRVAKMFLSNRMIKYYNLDLVFLAPGDELEFNDAYAQALSMTRYLRDELGEDRFWAVVLGCKELSFPDALRQLGKMPPRRFFDGYRRSLWRIALIGTLSSGSLFTPMAFMVIIVYFRKRRQNRKILDHWELEEAAATADELFSWDAVVEDPEAWKQEHGEEEEP